jgi:23S rRNA pseudouridine2605 synthase
MAARQPHKPKPGTHKRSRATARGERRRGQRPAGSRRGNAGREPDRPPPRTERLQKVLAAAGLGSRRQCEELILTGRVAVDRAVVTELGTKVDPVRQEIRVDGVLLPRPERVYYAVHKPPGVVSTNRDPSGRPRIIDLIPGAPQRLFPVGRLDLHSEGLILVTNDGELANQLTHPRYGVEKTYRALVAGRPSPDVLAELRRGIHLAEGVARVSQVRVTKELKQSTIMEIVLREGQNREIRRILARVGHKVLRLLRIAVGPVRLGNLPQGAYRPLGRQEVEALRNAADIGREKAHAKAQRREGSSEG